MSDDRMIRVCLFNMCMIVDEKNNKVLVQDKLADEENDWCGYTFPGGHVENSESVIASTIREVKEETGLDVDNLVPCGMIDWYNDSLTDRWLIFLYKTKYFRGEMVEETKEGKIFWMDIEEFKISKLAPNMEMYLKVFMNDDCNEAFGTWNENGSSPLHIV